jgi:hypothetical protein
MAMIYINSKLQRSFLGTNGHVNTAVRKATRPLGRVTVPGKPHRTRPNCPAAIRFYVEMYRG